MDSKDVNRKIREVIRPYLRMQGFTTFNDRNFWRLLDEDIHVINFQSFNSYLAEGLGVTSHSYTVNIGLYSRRIDLGYPVKSKNGLLTPTESQCHFRGGVKSTLAQGLNRDDLWSVKPNGSNLDDCIQNTFIQIQLVQETWFSRLAPLSSKVKIVETEPQQMGVLWGWGNNPSPQRSLFLACLFYETDRARSFQHLNEVVSGPSFKNLFRTEDEGRNYLSKIQLAFG